MPWSTDDALNELLSNFGTSGINGEVRASLQKHLVAAFNAGRSQEADAGPTLNHPEQENDPTEIEKRIAQLRRIVGHNCCLDTTIRLGRPDREVIYGDLAKRAQAEIDQLLAASHQRQDNDHPPQDAAQGYRLTANQSERQEEGSTVVVIGQAATRGSLSAPHRAGLSSERTQLPAGASQVDRR